MPNVAQIDLHIKTFKNGEVTTYKTLKYKINQGDVK